MAHSHNRPPVAGSRQDPVNHGRAHKVERRREARKRRATFREPEAKAPEDKLFVALQDATDSEVVVSPRKRAELAGCDFLRVWLPGYDKPTETTRQYRGWTRQEWDALQHACDAGHYSVEPGAYGDFLYVDLRPAIE